MSCDWDVACLDCGAAHGFYDMNHERDTMRDLVVLAPRIAAWAPVWREIRTIAQTATISLTFDFRGEIDVEWFAKHAGHHLAAVSEYLDVDGECGEWVKADNGDCFRCHRPLAHLGEHGPERDDGKTWRGG